MERADRFEDSLFINGMERKPRASGYSDREHGPGGAGPYRGEDSELFSTLLQKWPIWEKLVRPDFVEDVGETDKTAVGIHALVAGGRVGIGDVLEGTFHVEGPVFIQEELQAAGKLRGKFHVGSNRILIRPVPRVRIDHASSTLDVRNHDPVGLDEIITNQASDTDHIGAVAVPNVRSGGLQDGFKVSTQRIVDAGLGSPGIRGVQHPAQADIVLLVIKHRNDWALS